MLKINKFMAMTAVIVSTHAYGMNLQNVQGIAPKCDSLCVRGEFSDKVRKEIWNANKDGGDQADQAIRSFNAVNNTTVFFKRSPDVSYHLSLCLVESPKEGNQAGQPLKGYAQNKLIEIANQKLNPKTLLKDIENKSHFYEVLMMVHGYGLQNNEINHHYKITYKGLMGGKDSLNNKFPGGISHVHFAYKHGTRGDLAKVIDDQFIPTINKMTRTFSNPYQGKFDKFVGHVTLYKLSKVNQGKIDEKSPRFRTQAEYQLLSNVFTYIANSFKNNGGFIKQDGNAPIERISINGHELKANGSVKSHTIKYDITQ